MESRAHDILMTTDLSRRIQELVESATTVRRIILIGTGRENKVTYEATHEAWTAITDAVVKLALPPKEGV